jgi:hypothetical protein
LLCAGPDMRTMVLIGSLLFSGCATTKGKVAGSIAVLALVTDLTIGLNSKPARCWEDGPCFSVAELVAAGLGQLALASGIVALVAESHASVPAPAPSARPEPLPPLPPLVEAVVATDPRAAQLTRQARIAAELRQCVAVGMFGDRVRALDRQYYDRVFASDVTIRGCF